MKPTHPLPRGPVLGFLLLSLTACATDPVIETREVQVEVPVYVALPSDLTEVPAEPRLPDGEVSNEDLADLIERLQAWGRDLASKLRAVREVQP